MTDLWQFILDFYPHLIVAGIFVIAMLSSIKQENTKDDD